MNELTIVVTTPWWIEGRMPAPSADVYEDEEVTRVSTARTAPRAPLGRRRHTSSALAGGTDLPCRPRPIVFPPARGSETMLIELGAKQSSRMMPSPAAVTPSWSSITATPTVNLRRRPSSRTPRWYALIVGLSLGIAIGAVARAAAPSVATHANDASGVDALASRGSIVR